MQDMGQSSELLAFAGVLSETALSCLIVSVHVPYQHRLLVCNFTHALGMYWCLFFNSLYIPNDLIALCMIDASFMPQMMSSHNLHTPQ